MKHTHSRKKMLLSSVAMLLVALVALGSATFAWFTTNPTASASGIKMRTTASKGLVIKSETQNVWGKNAVLRTTANGTATSTEAFNLSPVSQVQKVASGTAADSSKFWTVNAAAPDAFGAANENMTSASEDNDYYSEKVYFALTAGADETAASSDHVYITGVTITPTAENNTNLEGTIRVAITDADNVLLGTWAIDTRANKANGVITGTGRTAGSFNPALAAATATFGTPVDTNQAGLQDQNDDDTSKFVNVYVYMDGQDDDCYTDNVTAADATAIINSITVNFKLGN